MEYVRISRGSTTPPPPTHTLDVYQEFNFAEVSGLPDRNRIKWVCFKKAGSGGNGGTAFKKAGVDSSVRFYGVNSPRVVLCRLVIKAGSQIYSF